MYKKLKIRFGIGVFIIVVTIVIVVFLQKKPMVERVNNPCIAFINVTVGQGGKTYYYDIPKSKVSYELNEALISLFYNAEIRNTFLPYPEIYNVSEDSVHITMKVLLDNSDSMSMLVNVCNVPQYNSVQFGNSHYHIVNHQKLYQDVYNLLSFYCPNATL